MKNISTGINIRGDRKYQKSIEARECPFCGDKWIEVYESTYGGFFVECQNCGANTILIVKNGQLRVGIIDGGVKVKLELENGNTIENLGSEDKPIRGKRARLYDLLNAQYGHELTEDEKKVIDSFMVKDPPDFKQEYNYVWCSSKKEK